MKKSILSIEGHKKGLVLVLSDGKRIIKHLVKLDGLLALIGAVTGAMYRLAQKN